LTISGASNSSSERKAAVSLLFKRGKRPSGRDVHSLAKRDGGFSVTFDPGEAGAAADNGVEGAPVWLELLESGLSFDLTGLAPGPPAAPSPYRRILGLDEDEVHALEALTLSPGPHLAGGAGMVPVLRTLAALGGSLAGLDGVHAVCWHSSRCWSEPGIYREAVARWVEGGVFPALTLTSLAMSSDGGMHSEGLALFTGQELRLEPELVRDPAAAAKLAVRLIDHLVERGRVVGREVTAGPDEVSLRLEPSANGQFVRVWQD
jgi:hypothetical protein